VEKKEKGIILLVKVAPETDQKNRTLEKVTEKGKFSYNRIFPEGYGIWRTTQEC
jgi:hypothetical protein